MKSYQKNWYQKNREQIREKAKIYSRNRRLKHPEKIKLLQDKWRHTKLERLASRPRPLLCEICSGTNSRRPLYFDHDHKTGKFRGWLCNNCNFTLGVIKDNKDTLRGMIDYLERNS